MARTKKYNPKYFPFSPGIPWQIKSGKYIIPQIDYFLWNNILEGKNIVVSAYGGYLESFFSLSFIEGLISIDPMRKILWLGNKHHHDLVRMQGMASPCHIDLDDYGLRQYPVPLFFDADGLAYINCLNNYIHTKSYWGQYPIKNKEPVLQQIFANALIPWRGYAPKLRKLTELSSKFSDWMRMEHLKGGARFVLLLPESFGSMHNVDCLNWNDQNVREFAAIMRRFGVRVVLCTNRPGLFHGSNVCVAPSDPITILNLLIRAWMVLSRDVDWHIITMLESDAHIVSKHTDNELNLFSNAEFIGAENVISTDSEWYSPMDVYKICEGLI
jgi:hypothetical protein